MNIAYLLIGGNIGDRQKMLNEAKKAIGKICGQIIHSSAIYETEAWGITDQNSFYNQALAVKTILAAEELLYCLQAIENNLGRQRNQKYGPRSIDIDIIFYNDDVVQTERLIVPHPQMQNRRFVLVPLLDIAPDKIHPLLKKTVAQLLAECPDTLAISKINST